MGRWLVIACAALLCPACATGGDPPEPEPEPEGGGSTTTTTAPAAPDPEGGSTCESGGACEQAPQVNGDTCLQACSDAAEKGCDWVTSMCHAADSITLGTARIPCLLATLVACGVALGSPLVCEHLCPH